MTAISSSLAPVDRFDAHRAFVANKFQSFLEQLSDNVFRGKGVICIDANQQQYVFRLVGQRFTLDEWQPVQPIKNKLVLIGRNLDHELLREQFENCLAASALDLSASSK